jgi:predicted nucleotidyltransferase
MKILISEILEKLKNYLPILYGDTLIKMILFGSHARGEATENSDIDILIVTKKYLSRQKKEEFYHFISQLCLQYDVLINSIQMLEDSFESENSPLLLNIRKEGITL